MGTVSGKPGKEATGAEEKALHWGVR